MPKAIDATPPDPAPTTDHAATPADTNKTPTRATPPSHHDPFPPLRAQPAPQAQTSTLGSVDPNHGYKLEAELTGWGAGVRYIRLAHYTLTAQGGQPYVVQAPVEAQTPDGHTLRLYPFAAVAITVNGQRVDLATQRWARLDGQPGAYQIDLIDENNQPAIRITRRYAIAKNRAPYDLRCEQRIENLTPTPTQIVWEQNAQGDIPQDDSGYLGDQRMLVVGYHHLEYNPSRQFIYTDDTYLPRQEILDGTPLWHGNEDLPAQRQLVWFGGLNRYFAAVTHPWIKSGAGVSDGSNPFTIVPALDSTFTRLGMQVIGQGAIGNGPDDPRAMVMTLATKPIDLPANGHVQLDLSLYAGPRKSEVFDEQPYKALSFAKLIVYELGCAMCTFQWLAKWLLGFLKVIHGLVWDWGVAIVILVLCVRLVLHPITKKSQINMFKMSKQMQTLQPEIEKLKKKYKNDQQKFQQEQLRLWREKGVNPFNMLGCLPMFLQTPIWVALYAMLYFAIELRHQPAFYGLFQAVSNNAWAFLGDLSRPDNFIRFGGEGYTLNLIFIHPKFAGINLLPMLMAVVFYFQQKLTTPPPATEQAAQQQKMMKFMVLLFPVMLYSAPSGLTLYILASTFAGIVDSYLVRKHVKEQEQAGTLFEKKPPKPGGLIDRINKTVEAKQRQMQEQQQRLAGKPSKQRKKR